MEVWFEDYAKIKARLSSHQTYRVTLTTTRGLKSFSPNE